MRFCVVNHIDNVIDIVEIANKNNGFCKHDGKSQNYLAHIGAGCFVANRSYMEDEPSYKQIIPVVVLIDEDTGNVVVYQRKSKHTEQRLAGSLTPAIGGHAEGEDLCNFVYEQNVSPYETVNGLLIPTTISNALLRELEEETGLNPDTIPMNFEGFIFDNSNEVGSVHLGLLFFGYTKLTNEVLQTISSADEFDHCFTVDKAEMVEMIKDPEVNLESWGRIIFEHILKEYNE